MNFVVACFSNHLTNNMSKFMLKSYVPWECTMHNWHVAKYNSQWNVIVTKAINAQIMKSLFDYSLHVKWEYMMAKKWICDVQYEMQFLLVCSRILIQLFNYSELRKLFNTFAFLPSQLKIWAWETLWSNRPNLSQVASNTQTLTWYIYIHLSYQLHLNLDSKCNGQEKLSHKINRNLKRKRYAFLR